MQVNLNAHVAGENYSSHYTAQMKGSPDRIQVCTTTYFDGIIGVIDPDASWVARWQRTCMSYACHAEEFRVQTCQKQNMCEGCTPFASRAEYQKT
jgi:hypothetical protein